MAVTELGYMGLSVSDLDAWKAFARDVLGLEVVDEGERDRCYLRMDYWHHRIVLHAKAAHMDAVRRSHTYLDWLARNPEFSIPP